MSIQITWLGHSAFWLNIDGNGVLLDPFITGNPMTNGLVRAADLSPSIIFLSHAHSDHLGDTVAIARRTRTKVVSNVEICHWLNAQGVENTSGQNVGGGCDYGFVHCRFTQAWHSSSFPDGSYGGTPCGFLLTTPSGKRLYFAGDTALFGDMALIGRGGLDVAFLPIGDHFTMGPEDSLAAIDLLKPRYVIPMHYKTWPVIDQDAARWAKAVNQYTQSHPIVIDPGTSFELPD